MWFFLFYICFYILYIKLVKLVILVELLKLVSSNGSAANTHGLSLIISVWILKILSCTSSFLYVLPKCKRKYQNTLIYIKSDHFFHFNISGTFSNFFSFKFTISTSENLKKVFRYRVSFPKIIFEVLWNYRETYFKFSEK